MLAAAPRRTTHPRQRDVSRATVGESKAGHAGVILRVVVAVEITPAAEPPPMNRRTFLSAATLGGAGVLLDWRPARIRRGATMVMPMCGAARPHAVGPVVHPTPRKGITGTKVMTAAQLAKSAYLIPLFDGIRAIPDVADGIRCSCGCAELPGYYSLLSCYEGDAMALICPICQGAGKLTVRLHTEGQTLVQIRIAVDAQFG